MEANIQKMGKGRALVTGASSGIGKAFAERLAARGHDLIIVARDTARLEALARRLRDDRKVDVKVHTADLTDPAALAGVCDLAAAGVDLLINNAGYGTLGPFAQLDIDGEEREIRLNVIALLRLTRAVLPGMIARGSGTIVNVASMAALQPGPFMATYCATKAFVTNFTDSLAEELRGSGVRAFCLLPGFTRTEFQPRSGVDPKTIPNAAWMTAEEVVDSALAALERGRVIHVPGVMNRATAVLVAFIPRFLTRRISGIVMRRVDRQKRISG